MNSLAFTRETPINPFMFALFTTLINKDSLKTENKHLINIYKNTTALTLQYLKNTMQIFEIEAIVPPEGDVKKTKIIFDRNNLLQQPYLLNKIIAARLYLCMQK